MFRSASLKITTAIAFGLVAVSPVIGASHREAPNITEMPKVDNTDVYAFRSYEPGRAGFVTLISNFQPGENPGDGPNYYTMDPNAIYEIHIDNNGDAVEDLTYQFKFTNTLQNGTGRTYTVGGKTLPFSLRHNGQITNANDPDQGEYENYTVTQIAGERQQSEDEPGVRIGAGEELLGDDGGKRAVQIKIVPFENGAERGRENDLAFFRRDAA